MTEDINPSKQILIFIAVVLGMTILLAVISMFLKVSTLGVNVVIPLIAAMIAGQGFVKKYGRAPTKDEAKRLTILSFFFFVGLQFLFLIIAIANPAAKALFAQMNSQILSLILIFVVFFFGISFFMIRWGYGGMTRKFADRLNK